MNTVVTRTGAIGAETGFNDSISAKDGKAEMKGTVTTKTPKEVSSGLCKSLKKGPRTSWTSQNL